MRPIFLWLTLVFFSATAAAQAPELTPALRQWIAAHRDIRVAPDPDLAPIDGLDQDGRQRGLAADYLKAIADRTGLRFRVVRTAGRNAALVALRQHHVDLIPSALVSARADSVIYSAPYLRLAAVAYVRHGNPEMVRLEALDRHKVGVVADQIWPELLAAKGSKAQIETFPDLAAALRSLQEGKVDALVSDPITTTAALERLGLGAQIDLSGQLDLETPVALAVRADWPQLREILDVALKSISVEDEKALRARWIKTDRSGASDADATLAALPASNAAAIAAALKALPAQRDLSADARKQAEDQLHLAQDDSDHADQLVQELQTVRQAAASADADAKKLEDALARDNTGALLVWRAALPERATVEQLEALLAREREALTDARNAVAQLEADLRRQSARPAQLRDELAAAHAVLDSSGVTVPSDTVNSPALASALRLRTQSAQRLATIEVALLDVENRSYEPRMRLLSVRLRDRQRAINEFGQHVAALETLILNRTGADVADLCGRIANQRSEVATTAHVLTLAADANVELCSQLAGSITRLTDLRAQKQALDAAQQETDQALENTQERIHIGGVTEAVGLILLAEQRKLKPLPQLKRQLAAVQTELAKTRMDLIDLRERQTALNDVAAAVDLALSHVSDVAADRLGELRAALFKLLNTRSEIVPRLIAQQTRLTAALADAEQDLNDLTATTEKLGALLDARLLWTPSHTPLNLAWARQLPSDFVEFFASRRWPRALDNAFGAVMSNPVLAILAVLSLGALLILRRRAPASLENIGVPMRRIRTDGYQLTGEAIAWTLLTALPIPFVLWLLGKLFQSAEDGSGFTESVGNALITLVWPAAALTFVHALTVEKGLAQYHFRWPRSRREGLHDAALPLSIVLLPTIFLVGLMARPGSDAPLDTLGRSLLALALLIVGWIGWRLLAPGRLWTARDTLLQEPLRVRQFARMSFSTMCGVFAALDLLGYFVTAATLSEHLLESLGALLCIATLQGMAVRWLVLGERRLALKRAQEKIENENAEGDRVDGEALPELPEAEEITVANVGAQTRRLLRALTLLGGATLLLWIWSDVTPALSLLGNISVWDSSQTIAGKEIALHISLRDIIEAVVVLLLTWVATRNLPGFLEVSVLRRFHVDAPTRYALTSVTRYAILFAGTLMGLSMLGLRWSNLQWLAAGFSVGLGFGMQEIFANFISGLIVLFERPIRVGDVISIGTVEGTVARIRTRATTIVDWDNKEVVVPNKSFITERLVNWTLSDTTTRVVIKVGIAYRNDPAQAQKLLLEVAAGNALVLQDPAPNCWMTGFGDSTQDFELRVYVAEISQRNPVRTELQMRIVEVFRENDIELAFPQMDLWLRNQVQVQLPGEPPRADGSVNQPPSIDPAKTP